MKDYKKLEVWQISKDLVIDLYRITKEFPKEEIFGLTSQIRRAAVSISANLAEGNGRNGDLELKRFLNIAFGSASELETLIIIVFELKYINEQDYKVIISKLESIQKMLSAFINKLQSNS